MHIWKSLDTQSDTHWQEERQFNRLSTTAFQMRFFFFFFFWEACELNRQQRVNAMKILRSINQLLKERCQGHCLWWVPHEEPRGTVLHEDHQEIIHNYPYQILRDVAFVGCHFFKLDKHWLIRQIGRYLVSVFDGYCTVMVINWSRLQLMQPFCWLEAR